MTDSRLTPAGCLSGNESVTALGRPLTQIKVPMPVLASAPLICLVEPQEPDKDLAHAIQWVLSPSCLQLRFRMKQWFCGPKVLAGPATTPNCLSTEFNSESA